MKPLNNRFTAWLLTLTLLATLLPLYPASSADAASAYFQFDDYSTTISSPTDVNGNVIDIAGTFNSVAQSSLGYKIEKLVKTGTGTTEDDYKVAESSVGSNIPVITGTNSFRFTAVQIYDGLNRITVTGTNTQGNIVNGTAYVNFTNVPVISEIKLIDGTTLPEGVSVVTSNPTATLSLKAPNATKVTVNGTEMFGGSGSSYVLSGIALNHGLNKLTIIASNGSKTYQLTRQLIYYNASLTAYNVMLDTYQLDGKPTISAAITGKPLSGRLILPTADPVTASSPAPTFTVQLFKTADVSTGTPIKSVTTTGTYIESTNDYAIYSFTTNGDFSLNDNGNYTFKIIGPNASAVDLVAFDYLKDGSPVITGVKQAYSVTENSSNTIDYQSIANFSENATVSQLPLWIVLEASNFGTGGSATLKIELNGADVTDSSMYAADQRTTIGGYPVIKLKSLPAGNLKLTFTITSGGLSNSIVRNVIYYPAPAIQIDNLYTGQTFNSDAEFKAASIMGRLLNFTNATDINTVKATLNGKSAKVGTDASDIIVTASNGTFTLVPSALTLVAGANTLTFSGTAGGIPVSTSVTIYLFSKEAPVITNIHPVPYVLPPSNDSITLPQRKFSDTAVKFAVTDDNEYTTTEKSLDLLFKVMEFDTLEVQINGNKVATGDASGTTLHLKDSITTDSVVPYIDMYATRLPLMDYTLDPGQSEKEFQIRLSEIKLPASGSTNFTIILRKGTNTVSQTITVIRDLSPYLVLSPKLPNEAVINANFLNVSIKAEGADQILIGKTAMTKGEGDIFRYEMQNLKAGKNTVKFTVVSGTQKVNGSFDVTYAADNSITAQYKASIASSGKLSIFTGDLQLAFPKNTFLRQANSSPGQDVKTVDLFNSQMIYFGIADRTDGRTVKKYNAVGETDGSGNALDGTIKTVAADSYATDRLRPKTNFSYASDLYWIDAGYFDGTTTPSGDFNLVSAMQPYQASNMFYGRVYDPSKWLEPSQRGTITIKYDAAISNAYGQNLSVWRYTNNGWENIGGVVNTSNKTVTASFDGFGFYTVMGLRYSFSDIIGHKYARLSLESMFSHGIMNNKDSNSFGVYENITRGEFAQMLVKVMGIPLQYDPNNMTFDDVQPFDYPDQPYWNYRYVETAVKKGYIRGKSPRLFFPNDNLTRGEAAVIIARALNLVKSNADAAKDLTSLQKVFTDANQADTYAVSSILAVNKAGFITGIANTTTDKKATYRYESDSNLTRADAAVIAERVMRKLKKL